MWKESYPDSLHSVMGFLTPFASMDLHSDPKQFLQKFDFTLSCGIDLNLAHTYKGVLFCFTSNALTGSRLCISNKVTSLLDEKGLLVDDDSCFVCFFPNSAMEVSKACAQRLMNSSRSW